ncbi:MAG: 1,4-alpha-glucan branching protein GlgB [Eubacteriales bacterium]
MMQNSGDLAAYLFHQGTNYRAYQYMGVHRCEGGYVFRVWAPGARSIRLVGDFNGWEGQTMIRSSQMGIWEAVVESDNLEGQKYKYAITSGAGEHYKADPYAAYSETLKKTASIVWTDESFKWSDGVWRNKRKRIAQSPDFYAAPMHIYEVHLASWRTRDGKTTAEGENYLNYREIADLLVPYVKKMGYTHVELLPIGEYPYDGSWGYQVCSYFAPTSRYGNPNDFKYFVNTLHKNGIGVLLDWVPAHFPKDEHGLREFDGSPLYEYQGWDRMEHKEWGTRCFDVGRNEVQSFLISSAMSWLDRYHIDGLRVDAVASMLYLDYARKPGEWIPNVNGDNKNLEAIAFFKKLNTALFGSYPDILMIAEESTAWVAITRPVHEGGLGFNFKWNMGWANDMYDYVQTDPYFRKYHHKDLNFSLSYAFSENYILPVSHDEVVHGKKSLIDKMWGNYDQKFAGLRCFFVWQMTHPGKKMTFMGCEFGQFREWDYENQLEWFMLDYPKHAAIQTFSEELNNFYLSRKELWQVDFSWDGFSWIYADRDADNLIAFTRMDKAGHELVVVINFSAVPYRGYGIPVESDAYRVVFNTEESRFGGNGMTYPEVLTAGENSMITPDLSPLSALILEPVNRKKKSGKKPSEAASAADRKAGKIKNAVGRKPDGAQDEQNKQDKEENLTKDTESSNQASD